jgi:hypothetical protein
MAARPLDRLTARLSEFYEPVEQLATAVEGFVDLADRGWPLLPILRPRTK